MTSLSTSHFSLVTRALQIVALVMSICADSDVYAEELTGVVKQPEKPYGPADKSTVIVFETDKNGKRQELDRDITGINGVYTFQVQKGKSVIVQASWRTDKSSPGETPTNVVANPTMADVQLLPPATASIDQWQNAGRLAVKIKGGGWVMVPNSLHKSDVPSSAVFQFITGASMEAKSTPPGLSNLQMFDLKDWEVVAQGVKQAEVQFKQTNSLPKYEELASKLKGSLTEQQHIEILVFVAPAKPGAEKVWEAAVIKAVGEAQAPQVLSKKATFDAILFQASKVPPTK
jgi:hypothetical protein